ncbi:outer membrane lipid asymmetry maintenance protein MlaD [Thorsellia anophelis]|uniref:Phospholipid/cholesterol/gamma-HCH transport system substrate-binding protein n=1 Tax=Thorsellia anophelis DSM 18579 TaxID=1123402 RepID=A0A1I0ABL5_9GAMM|nr:outer membrane lipid asymmetry maintenance protein MlaD [Thorsellia anophelis]SES90642.1 phospholipid/cholesterol/gamma-HCH transport system substrate-binding protein [Thorsellia anophelis DSM 18579]
MKKAKIELLVGFFMLLGTISLIFLLLKVADIKNLKSQSTYTLYATFDNVGSLKIRSPVKIGGVVIGRVTNIKLDEKTYTPVVTMAIDSQYNQIPNSSSLSVRSAGLLGEQFLALNMGVHDPDIFQTYYLSDQNRIEDTKSAIVLEDIIGQIVYSLKGGDKPSDKEIPSEIIE